jgi:hypothetical protein
VGPNALPYQPFKKYRQDSDGPQPTVMDQRADVVDYAEQRLLTWNRLASRSGLTGVTTSQYNVHPVLISEREMARLGQRYNPSLGLLYTTEGPLEERHPDKMILRAAHKREQSSRVPYGETGMSA